MRSGTSPARSISTTALIALAPEDRAVEDSLRQLAEAARDPARLASGLAAAAKACRTAERRVELLVRAAHVEDRQLGHPERASELFEDAIGGEAGAPELRLESLRRLEEIYDALGNKAEAPERPRTARGGRAQAGRQDGSPGRWPRSSAVELGDVDRAIGAWQARLALDPADVDALAAARDLLVRSERWPAVIDLLRRRIDSAPPALSDSRRPDRDRDAGPPAARGHRPRDRDLARGGHALRRRRRECRGARRPVRRRAARSPSSRSCCHATPTSIAGTTPTGSRAWRMRTALELGDAAAAVEWYGRALDVDPAHEGARGGLQALLGGRIGRTRRGPAARRRRREDRLLAAPARSRSAAAGGRVRPEGQGPASWRTPRCARRRAPAITSGRSRGCARRCPSRGPARGWSRRCCVWRRRPAISPARRGRSARRIAAGGAPPLTLAHLHERRGSLLEERVADLAAAARELRRRPGADARAARAATQPGADASSGWAGSPRRPACSSMRRRRPMRATRC